MSSGRGSSTDASCWAARKMRLSLSRACSSARVELGRPMTNGIIMCGKTTTSRRGTIGRVSYTSNDESIRELQDLVIEQSGDLAKRAGRSALHMTNDPPTKSSNYQIHD